MNFLSTQFWVLLISVLILTRLIRPVIHQKLILLAASCLFYAFWDWRFLGLLAVVTVVDYYVSVGMQGAHNEKTRKTLLAVSIASSLAILGFFKYFNFFTATFDSAASVLGVHLPELGILLPVGISFYTFESISYVMDVYHRKTEPAQSLLDYSVFIAFFPRLVAGPIMRAANFLPQLQHGIRLEPTGIIRGAQLFGQGLLKKIVVADTLALIVDQVYGSPWLYSSATVWLGVCSFAVQIYFDFSGYSDMALGIARILGFELPVNFNLPFTSQSFAEFWQRWHISLSTWLRDYLYFPLGGNQKGAWRTYFNLIVTMLLGGLWHGASWNFVLWGGLHGLALGLERAFTQDRPSKEWRISTSWFKALGIFLWVALTCVFFRSPSMEMAGQVFSKLAFIDPGGVVWFFYPAALYLLIVFIGGLLMRLKKIDLATMDYYQPYFFPVLAAEYLFIFLFATRNNSPFLYFQF